MRPGCQNTPFHGLIAVNFAKSSTGFVVVNKRSCGFLINGKALLHCRFIIISTLIKFPAAVITDIFFLRRTEFLMERSAAFLQTSLPPILFTRPFESALIPITAVSLIPSSWSMVSRAAACAVVLGNPSRIQPFCSHPAQAVP